MSLERKDVRGYLDADLHAALIAICEADGITSAEFIERLLVPVIQKRIHDAITLADFLQRHGITRSDPEPERERR